MKKRVLVLSGAVAVTALLIFAIGRLTSEGQELPADVVTSSLHSNVLGEDREFLVRLPASYAPGSQRRYPTLYVLDGASQIAHTAASATALAQAGEMPEVLVVGVPSVSGAVRNRDYTPPGMRQDGDKAGSPEGRGDRFLEFLKTELIPRVERDYPAGGPRLLAGWSRGALLVVYSLVAEPSLFDARFAHSPAMWRDDDAMIGRLDTFLASSPHLAGSLYLSLGDQENEKMTRSFKRLVALLEAKAPRSLRWRADFTPGADHNSNAQRATPVGLKFCFSQEREPSGR